MTQTCVGDHTYRRIQKLAWPFSKEKVFQTMSTVWWKRTLNPSECWGGEDETLPVDAVSYALGWGADRKDLFGLMPTLPPEAVLMAYGHVIVRRYLHRASVTGDYFGGERLDREMKEDLHWVLDGLEKLGYPSHGLSVKDVARFFGDINSVHCHHLPTGLLRLRHLAGHYGWPEAVEWELRKRQSLAYRLWASVRVRAYALSRAWT